MIVPPTLLAVVVGVGSVVIVVVVFWLDTAHCPNFSRTDPPQYQQAAPLTS